MICFKYILCFQKIVAENIFMDNKYIFVAYEGIFDANIFCAERGKKRETYLQCDILSKFMSYISL